MVDGIISKSWLTYGITMDNPSFLRTKAPWKPQLPQVLSHLITLLGACYVARRAHTSVQLGKAALPGTENGRASVRRIWWQTWKLDVFWDVLWTFFSSFFLVPRFLLSGVKWCKMGGLPTFMGSNGGKTRQRWEWNDAQTWMDHDRMDGGS